MKADKITTIQHEVNLGVIQSSLDEVRADYDNLAFKHEQLLEHLGSLDLMSEDNGWTSLFGPSVNDGGPDLGQLHSVSDRLREFTAVDPHMKQGNSLRSNYVLDGGPHYDNVSGGRGRGNVNVQDIMDLPQNRRNYFSEAAYKKRMKARYTDGHVVWLGNDATKTLTMIPFSRITATLTNPEDSSELWAVRVIKQVNSNVFKPDLQARWVFVNEFVDKRVGSARSPKTVPFPVPGNKDNGEPIDYENRVFVEVANPTVGWLWGTPDSLASLYWVRLYRDFMISGTKMSNAMAMIWSHYKTASAAGGQNASVKLGTGQQGSGQTAFGGGEWNVLPTAGKSYDFEAGLLILAAAAAGLSVSVVALASAPSAAGGSYGSAQTLDLPGRIAISSVRNDIAEFDETVLRWLGAANPKVSFDALVDAEQVYRLMQAEMFYWDRGLRSGEEQKQAMDKVKGKPGDAPVKVPDGLQIPNNINFPGTLSNDSQPAGGSQTPSPDQGVSSGAGGAGNVGNIRNDTIS